MIEHTPVLILAGALGGAVEALGPGHVGGLSWTETLQLAPLDGADGLQLIGDLCDGDEAVDDGIRQTIIRFAGGNPYYIELLLSDWRRHQAHSLVGAESVGDGTAVTWKPPENLRAAFAREYAGLSDDAQHVLQVLAAAGRALPGAEVRPLLGVGARQGDRGSLELVDRGVARVECGGVAFEHELPRAAA